MEESKIKLILENIENLVEEMEEYYPERNTPKKAAAEDSLFSRFVVAGIMEDLCRALERLSLSLDKDHKRLVGGEGKIDPDIERRVIKALNFVEDNKKGTVITRVKIRLITEKEL